MASSYPAVVHCQPTQPSLQAYQPTPCSPFDNSAPFFAQPAGYAPMYQAGPSEFGSYPSMVMPANSFSSFSTPAATASYPLQPPPGYPQGPAVGQYTSMTFSAPPPPFHTTVAPAPPPAQKPQQGRSKLAMLAQGVEFISNVTDVVTTVIDVLSG